MSCGYIDFTIQENVFSTKEIKEVFDEKARIKRWLAIEGALASAQGELGVIPKQAAEEISEMANIDFINLSKVKEGYKVSKNSLIPVINGLKDACKNDLGQYVHFGITTQDVIDTGQVLEIKDSMKIVDRDLNNIASTLFTLAQTHEATPMIGRTHGQQALPITFGLKVAIWLEEVRRHIARIRSLFDRVLVGQLSGAVGTMAALGDLGFDIQRKTMEKLGLGSSPVPWHTSRDNSAELAFSFSILTNTLAKMANEVFALGKSEVLELRESAEKKEGASSSAMPHKKNPVLCQRIIVLSRHVRALSSVVSEAMVHEHERDPRSLWSEWLAIPQICIYTATALAYTIEVFNHLSINPKKMKENLSFQGEKSISEHLMFRIAKKMGKMKAHKKLHSVMSRADEQGMSIRKSLLQDPEIKDCLNEDDFYLLDHPENYTGQSIAIVKKVLNS